MKRSANKHRIFSFWCAACMIITACWPICAQSTKTLWALHNDTYDVVYDTKNHVPLAVTWVLHPQDFSVTRKRVTKYFKADSRVPKPRVKDADYRNSGYMRGHCCPAADRTTTKTMQKETFIMTNIAPMTAALNCGQWATLETQSRQLAIKYDSEMIPVVSHYLANDSIYIGRGLIRVPSHYSREVRVAKNDSLIDIIVVQNR